MVAVARPRTKPTRWLMTDEPWRFDGNDHDKRVVMYVLTSVEEFTDGALESLMESTIINDDLSWCLLPTNGFRL